MFFALAWHPVAEAIQRACPSTWTSFYLDDGHLVGPLDELAGAMQVLHDQGPALGVLVNLAKCRLWRPPGGGLGPVPRQLQEVPQVALEEGLKVLGIPVGHSLFVDALFVDG